MVKKVNNWHSILAAIFRFFLSLRYRITVAGEEVVKAPVVKLFLPNHPALIDPIILCAYIYKFNNISPAISAKYYRNKLFKPLLKLANAIPIADLSEGERDIDVYNKLSVSARKELEKGHHILFYPAGQLASGTNEKLFNKQGAFRLVAELPENTQVIGVKISGLWGSRWSRANTGKTPDFIKTFFKSLLYLIVHLFVFCPKRPINIEFFDLTSDLKKLSCVDRKAFNIFLENFYNN